MSATTKQRLDIIMVKQGLVESREKAKRIILSGVVRVEGRIIDKAGTPVSPGDNIIIEGDPIPFVSRGGLKLQKALDVFRPPITDRIYMDVGASTGGFTDCLLQYGAKKVYSVDVGYGQLAWKLRQDPRVVVMERINIRNMTIEDLGEIPQGAVIDVSFISLKLVLPVVLKILSPDSHIICLVKPQFEAGRKEVGKNGVIKSPQVHKNVLKDILAFCENINIALLGLTYSPIKGPKGNIEFLIYLYNKGEGSGIPRFSQTEINALVDRIIKESHGEL